MNRRAVVLYVAGLLVAIFPSCGGPESVTLDAVEPEGLRNAAVSEASRCMLCKRDWPTRVWPDRGKVALRAGFWCKYKPGTVRLPLCGPCWSRMSHEQRAEFVQQWWEATPPDWLNSEQGDAMLEEIRSGRSGGLLIEAADLPS